MYRHTSGLRLVLAAATSVLVLAAVIAISDVHLRSAPRPNVVVITTDDQDVASVRSMPHVMRLLRGAGVTFSRHTVSYSLCCPSRATYLTGRLAHNHDVRSNVPPTGGYAKLDATRTLPVWLTRAGYVTSHIGKYLNGYDGTQHSDTRGVPPGWMEWHGGVDPTTYRSFGYVLNSNGVSTPYGYEPSDYQSDVFTTKAVDFIRRRGRGNHPFFLDVAYVVPHHEIKPGSQPSPKVVVDREGRNDESMFGTPPVPARRHAGMFARARAPRPPSFNEADVSDKPPHIRRLPRLSPADVEEIDHWYRARLESLQAVDEGIARIVEALDDAGELRDTYIFFTSDNGWMQGEHRVALRKLISYEPSTRIPLIVRGPSAIAGGVVRDWTSNVDVPATILELAGARPAKGFELDGASLASSLARPGSRTGRVVFHEAFAGQEPYTAVRAGRWKYVEYASGPIELYDLFADPHELRRLPPGAGTARVRADLAGLLTSLRTCRGRDCVVRGYADAWRAPTR